jgi:hypothetical protein
MTLRNVVASVLFLALLGLPPQALACSCGPPNTPEVEREEATGVFRGRVLQGSMPHGESDFWRRFVFEVDEVWKGPLEPLQAIVTTGNSAACGRSFTVGQEYVVYTGPEQTVLLCNRVLPIDQAANDLAMLGAGEAPSIAPLEDRLRHAFVAGAWYHPERAGEGFIVDLLEDGRAMAFWFGYRADDAAAQSWLYGVGSFDGDTLHIADVMQPVGGGFGTAFDADAVEPRRWGELRLMLPAGGDGRVEWSSALPGYGSGSHALQRLSRPPRALITAPP